MPKEVRAMWPYDDIVVPPDFNARKALEKIEELAYSLDQNGLIVPLTLREGGPSKVDGKRKAFLVAGERRYRAIALLRDPAWRFVIDGKKQERKTSPASWNQVDAKFVKADERRTRKVNLIENIDREDLKPFEEAQAFQEYMDDFGVTQAQFCREFGLTEPHVSQRLSLLKHAVPEVRAAVEAGDITATHAREMVTLPASDQKEVLKEVGALQKSGKKVSVADVKQKTDKRKQELGIKQSREHRKKGVEYDEEKLSKAKEVYEGKSFDARPKTELMEQLGGLILRSQRANLSDATKQTTKTQIATIEWFLKLRETL